MHRALWAMALILAGWAGGAEADPLADPEADPVADALRACVIERGEAAASPAPCIETALAPCRRETRETHAVAILCYRETQAAFDLRTAAIVREIRETASEEAATLIAIETKYEILAGLLQCDRIEELAQALSDETAEAVARRKADCTAATSAAAFAALLIRAGAL